MAAAARPATALENSQGITGLDCHESQRHDAEEEYGLRSTSDLFAAALECCNTSLHLLEVCLGGWLARESACSVAETTWA